jgi:hypothetical protein
MRDEALYHQYANWKMENDDVLKYLIDHDSDLLIRFRHVIEVTDHLYDRLIDDPSYSEEEHSIFETGFYYMLSQLEEITTLLEKAYDNDISMLETQAAGVNLLLATIDFQNELLSAGEFDQKDFDMLVAFEKDILNHLEKRESVPESVYEKIDQASAEMFSKMDVDYFPVNDIFLEIADELGLI